MGRRKKLSDDECLRRFLLTVHDLPWARPALIQKYAGLRPRAFRTAQRLALARGVVEQGDLPSPARAERRFALTPAGAALLGQQLSLHALRDAYLRARTLDVAHVLLTEWLRWPGLQWARSPFTLPASAVRPPRPRWGSSRKRKPDQWGDGAYRSLRLDGLACVRFDSRRYLVAAILVDPGDISLDYFYRQFRTIYAWHRRPEFREHRSTFPVFVVITANLERLTQLHQLCRAASWRSERALSFRFITRAALQLPEAERLWRSQHGTGLEGVWDELGASSHLSLPPPSAECGWWSEVAENGRGVFRLGRPLTLKRKTPGLLKWAAKSNAQAARLVRDHQAVGVRATGLLSRVGQYPLITTSELAIIMGQTYKNIALGLKELQELGLIAHPNADEEGYAPTQHGLALLAAQAGMAPAEYAKLRRWPVKHYKRQAHYAVGVMLACRAHTRLVTDFLVGLRRYGPRARLQLMAWDHVQCVHEFPSDLAARAKKMETDPWRSDPDARRVIPDATGIVRAYGETPAQFVDMTFWLEIDRHTEKGAALMNKLERFYCYRSSTQSRLVRDEDRPRLLIVVERNDESRLQAFRRQLLKFNKRWHMELDVCLSRVDLLDDGKDRLDPTRKAWRTLASNDVVHAFDSPARQGPELPR